jgi:C-terminal processing protease CtpA/Prc
VLCDVHPKTYHGFSKQQKQLFESLRFKITEPMDAQKFYFIVNKIFFSMKDAHTFLYPMKNKQNRLIKAKIEWLQDGLYVTGNGDKLKQGDKVIAIGGRSVDELLNELAHIIPSKNPHSIQCKAGNGLIREAYFDQLNLIQNDSVVYLVERGDTKLKVNMPLITKSDNVSKKISKPWVRFEIDEKLSLGILTLDSCRYNDEYKNKLKEFFAEARKHNIQHIAVDVRNNGGGNSMVIDEFLSYLNIKKYKTFSSEIRYSKATTLQRNTTKDKGYKKPLFRLNTRYNRKCPYPELIFNGKLYILTSAKTFSSANWFAVIVKDNKLGTVIGEPTGNAPTSYGDILQFQMPNTGFRFSCSYKKWIRPDTSNDPEDGLYPDVTVYTTIEDIIQNKDAQIEKLKAIVKAK